MGMPPTGRISPVRTRNIDLSSKKTPQRAMDFQTRGSLDNLSKISLGFYTGASGMARSNSKQSKLIPSRHSHILTDYRNRVTKSKSSHRIKGVEDVIYNSNRQLSPNLSQKSINFPSIERKNYMKMAWVPGGRHQ